MHHHCPAKLDVAFFTQVFTWLILKVAASRPTAHVQTPTFKYYKFSLIGWPLCAKMGTYWQVGQVLLLTLVVHKVLAVPSLCLSLGT